MFTPTGTSDMPVSVDRLTNLRTTFVNFADGTKKTLEDDWRTSDNPNAILDSQQGWKGKTVFKLHSKPTGKRLVNKQATWVPKPSTEPRVLGTSYNFS